MELSTLPDDENQQLKGEFHFMTESKKFEVANKVIKSVLSEVKSRLWSRFQSGEELSDRQLSLLVYDEDADEEVWKKIMERNLSESLRDKYIKGYLADRFTKQFAIQTVKEAVDLGTYFCTTGWEAFKVAVKNNQTAALRSYLPYETLCHQYWTINFAAAGFLVLVDLSHSLYLLYKGKINPNQVVKRMSASILSNSLAIAGGHYGCLAGAALGFSFCGPVGGLVGGIIGATIGGVACSLFGTLVTQKIWSLFEKDEKEKAFKELSASARKTLEVTLADDFKTITRQWKKKILEYHPDKRPNATEEEKKLYGSKFQEVHVAYQILKEEELKLNRISTTEIEKITKTLPQMIIEQDGWTDFEDDM